VVCRSISLDKLSGLIPSAAIFVKKKRAGLDHGFTFFKKKLTEVSTAILVKKSHKEPYTAGLDPEFTFFKIFKRSFQVFNM
jgi:hypothetical protein